MVRRSAITHRCITALLLAVYGLVGVVGYGLHDLFHVHHHHPLVAAGASSSTSCCCSHDGHSGHEHDQPANDHAGHEYDQSTHSQSSQSCDHSHDAGSNQKDGCCNGANEHHSLSQRFASFQESEGQPVVRSIEQPCALCELLAQAQQPPFAIPTQTLVAAVVFAPPADEVLFPLYLPSEHLARGPPSC